MSFFGVFVLVVLLIALNDATKRADEAERKVATIPQPLPQHQQAVEQTHDTIVSAFDLDTYIKENNITAFYCSHENKIYWVKDAEMTMFCPEDSTLLYAC